MIFRFQGCNDKIANNELQPGHPKKTEIKQNKAGAGVCGNVKLPQLEIDLGNFTVPWMLKKTTAWLHRISGVVYPWFLCFFVVKGSMYGMG